MGTPNGWQTIQLGDILSETQFKEVLRIINAPGEDKPIATRLAAYLEPFKKELEAKGVNHRYLAYLLEFMHNEGKFKTERKKRKHE